MIYMFLTIVVTSLVCAALAIPLTLVVLKWMDRRDKTRTDMIKPTNG